MACTYPVVNKLAIGARPKLCGKDGNILAALPYFGQPGPNGEEIQMRAHTVCLDHASEVAVWKLAQSIPHEVETL